MLWVGADGPDEHELVRLGAASGFEHVSAHEEIRIPIAPRIGLVRSDPAHFCGQVKCKLRASVAPEPLGVLRAREVVVASPRDHGIEAFGPQPLGEMGSEKSAPARYERPHGAGRVARSTPSGQSTRPIQREWLAAYHAIVRAIPSSHDTLGRSPFPARASRTRRAVPSRPLHRGGSAQRRSRVRVSASNPGPRRCAGSLTPSPASRCSRPVRSRDVAGRTVSGDGKVAANAVGAVAEVAHGLEVSQLDALALERLRDDGSGHVTRVLSGASR